MPLGPRPNVEMEDLPARVKRPVAPDGGHAPPAPDGRLVLATRDGDLKSIRDLLDEALQTRLFHIDTIDRLGRGLLWYAVSNGHLEATQLLLDRRANLHIRDAMGWTSLHLAVYHGHPPIARLLLERKSEVDVKTFAGQTPRWLAHSNATPGCGAFSQPHAEMNQLLKERGGTLGLPPPEWQLGRDKQIAKRPIKPEELRCNPEDGLRYTLKELMAKYVVAEQMYSEEECETYFRETMMTPSEDHAAWRLPVQEKVKPGEGKYG